ncbi:uncharacterized protein LOC144457142 [Phascolarctos cinereus]
MSAALGAAAPTAVYARAALRPGRAGRPQDGGGHAGDRLEGGGATRFRSRPSPSVGPLPRPPAHAGRRDAVAMETAGRVAPGTRLSAAAEAGTPGGVGGGRSCGNSSESCGGAAGGG